MRPRHYDNRPTRNKRKHKHGYVDMSPNRGPW